MWMGVCLGGCVDACGWFETERGNSGKERENVDKIKLCGREGDGQIDIWRERMRQKGKERERETVKTGR